MVKCFCNLCQSEGNLIRVPAKLGDIDNIQLDFCEKCAQKVFEKKDWEAYKQSIKPTQTTKRAPKPRKQAEEKEDTFMNPPAKEADPEPAAEPPKKTRAGKKDKLTTTVSSFVNPEESEKFIDILAKASDAEIGYKTLLEINFGKERGTAIWKKTSKNFDQLKAMAKSKRY